MEIFRKTVLAVFLDIETSDYIQTNIQRREGIDSLIASIKMTRLETPVDIFTALKSKSNKYQLKENELDEKKIRKYNKILSLRKNFLEKVYKRQLPIEDGLRFKIARNPILTVENYKRLRDEIKRIERVVLEFEDKFTQDFYMKKVGA